MVSEIHIALINIARERSNERHCAVLSLLELKNTEESEQVMDEKEDDWQVDIDELVAALTDVGSNWESVSLKSKEGREGWEEVLVGFLKDVSPFMLFSWNF